MPIKCWQCSEELDTSSIERDTYIKLINNLRDKMCENAKNDKCDMWWRHEDCHIIGILIQELKDKL